ncbi:TPA: alcohol dehydrogenase catalytic domain-containing protein, partial [Escherichia coli]|nr:alcohol dehydrogenase catalytic domain-containing protein [Escherichia coli]
MSLAHGYAVRTNTAPLEPFTFERRAVGANDVRIEVLYSGICHSDLHQARDDWGGAEYPMVPGHEIIGRVVEVGPAVTRLSVGDIAGVGCMVDSCRHCDACDHDLEQYCEKGPT